MSTKEILNNNLKILFEYNFSRLKLTKIINENLNLLDINSDELKKRIEYLINFYKEKDFVCNLIYSSPKILTENLNLEELKTTFEKFGLDFETQKYLELENTEILLLPISQIIESLELIMNEYKEKTFIDFILYFPELIGVTDITKIKNWFKI